MSGVVATPHPTSLRSATFSRKGRRKFLGLRLLMRRDKLRLMDDWLQARAREMRREPVLYKRRLWKILRDRRLGGLKFRRQVVIGRYIADFVCLRHRLIVEADGPQHEDRVEDAARDAWLRDQGFRVLRFPNAMIENHAEKVVAEILGVVEAVR